MAVGTTGVVLGIGIGSGAIGGEEVVTATRDVPPEWTGPRVKVEVLNGGGVAGMAGLATERLREARFDVVSFGNAGAFDPDRPSVVIDRVGRTDAARAVAEALGIDNVLSDPKPNLSVDVTVVVGRTWTGQAAWDPVSSEQAPRLWDPRTWFGT
jgi:hypothetical protein